MGTLGKVRGKKSRLLDGERERGAGLVGYFIERDMGVGRVGYFMERETGKVGYFMDRYN